MLIFCEDMSEGWSLAMLVDEQGIEVAEEGVLSRGLVPQGFCEVGLTGLHVVHAPYLQKRN